LIENELKDCEREKEKIIDARTILTYENEDDNENAVPQLADEDDDFDIDDFDDDINDESHYEVLGRGPECRN
jgi:hypothetical protein